MKNSISTRKYSSKVPVSGKQELHGITAVSNAPLLSIAADILKKKKERITFIFYCCRLCKRVKSCETECWEQRSPGRGPHSAPQKVPSKIKYNQMLFFQSTKMKLWSPKLPLCELVKCRSKTKSIFSCFYMCFNLSIVF